MRRGGRGGKRKHTSPAAGAAQADHKEERSGPTLTSLPHTHARTWTKEYLVSPQTRWVWTRVSGGQYHMLVQKGAMVRIAAGLWFVCRCKSEGVRRTRERGGGRKHTHVGVKRCSLGGPLGHAGCVGGATAFSLSPSLRLSGGRDSARPCERVPCGVVPLMLGLGAQRIPIRRCEETKGGGVKPMAHAGCDVPPNERQKKGSPT